jgi:hypothetical protein
MTRPAALCRLSSTSGFALSIARLTNSTGSATAMSRLRIHRQSSMMRSAACFFPCIITMFVSRAITGSRRCADIAAAGAPPARQRTTMGRSGDFRRQSGVGRAAPPAAGAGGDRP